MRSTLALVPVLVIALVAGGCGGSGDARGARAAAEAESRTLAQYGVEGKASCQESGGGDADPDLTPEYSCRVSYEVAGSAGEKTMIVLCVDGVDECFVRDTKTVSGPPTPLVVSEQRAGAIAKSIIAKEAKRQGYGSSIVRAVTCVSTRSSAFSCIVTASDGTSIGGTLTCGETQCVWRGELRGG